MGLQRNVNASMTEEIIEAGNYAKTEGEKAQTNADYALEQGDYAKAEADRLVGTDVSVLDNKIGNLSELNTSQKDSLVSAVNDTASQLAETMNYLNEFGVNVKYNGAIGDGVIDSSGNYVSGTDDTLAIQATIDYVSSIGGGTVYVPDGIFVISASLKMKSNVKLIGNGTILCKGVFPSGTSLESAAITIRDNTKQLENVTVDGLTIYAPQTTTDGEARGIYVSWAKNVTIQNNKVYNSDDSGIRVDGYGGVYGASANRGAVSETYTVYTEDIFISNNKVYNTKKGHGIEVISYPSNVIVMANKIYNPFQHGIRMSGVYQSIVADNIIKSAGEFGIYLAGYKLKAHDNLINGEGVGKYGFRLMDLYDSEIHSNTICNVTLEGIHGGITGYPIASVSIKDNEILNFGMSGSAVWGIILRNQGIAKCIVTGNRVISANGTSQRGINLEKQSTDTLQPTNCIVEDNIVSVPSVAKVVVLGKVSEGGSNIARNNMNLDTMTYFENKKGITQFNGDGTTKLFRIPHGLGVTPTYFNVTPTSVDAGNGVINYVSLNSTYLDVNFKTAPIAGTNNVSIAWECNI